MEKKKKLYETVPLSKFVLKSELNLHCFEKTPSHASHMITNLKMSSNQPVWLQFLSKSPSGCETATVTPFRDDISQPCLYPSVLPRGFYSSLIMKAEHVLLTSAKLCSIPQSILLSKAFVRRKH